MHLDDITLVELFGLALKKWRTILLIALVVSLIITSLFCWSNFSSVFNAKIREEKIIESQIQIEKIEQEVSTLEKMVNNQVDFINNSTYMKLSPSDVQKGTISFYVDVKNASDLELARNVAYALYSYALSGELNEYLVSNVGISDNYLMRLIEADLSRDEGMSCVTITAKHYDANESSKMIDAIEEAIYLKAKELNSMGDFSLVLTTKNITSTFEKTISSNQDEADKNLSALQTKLSSAKQELTNKKMMVPTVKNFVIVFFVLFFVLLLATLIVLVVLYMIVGVFSSKIKIRGQITRCLELDVIADMTLVKEKANVIDRFAYKICGEDIFGSQSMAEEYLSSRVNCTTSGKGQILFLGDTYCNFETIKGALSNISSKCVYDKEIYSNSVAVKDAFSCSNTIVVVKKNKTRMVDLVSVIKDLEKTGTNMAGILLI